MSHLSEAIQNLDGAAQHLDGAVENLKEAARRDDKTNLWNGMALEQDALKIGTDLTSPDVVIFGDLNRFKQINDQHGHNIGDTALRRAGVLMTEHFEDCMAKLFRRSGDEFVVLLKKDKLHLFKEKAAFFQSCELLVDDKPVHFSMSFGYACTDAEDVPDFKTLLDRAEQACIRAKSLGDGKCVEWTAALSAEARVRLRSRCPACDSTISCDVLETKAPEPRLLRICPTCETPLQHPPPTQVTSTTTWPQSS